MNSPSVSVAKERLKKPACVGPDPVCSGCCGQALKGPVLYSFKIYGDYTGEF